MNAVTWATELQGDRLDLEHLAAQLTGNAMNVTLGEKGYLLRSERLNGVQDIPLVVAEVGRLVAVLNGLLLLLRFSKTPLVSAHIYGLDATGTICTQLISVPNR